MEQLVEVIDINVILDIIRVTIIAAICAYIANKRIYKTSKRKNDKYEVVSNLIAYRYVLDLEKFDLDNSREIPRASIDIFWSSLNKSFIAFKDNSDVIENLNKFRCDESKNLKYIKNAIKAMCRDKDVNMNIEGVDENFWDEPFYYKNPKG